MLTGSRPPESQRRGPVRPRGFGAAEPGPESPARAPQPPEEVVAPSAPLGWCSSAAGARGGDETLHPGSEELSRPGQR